MNSFLPNLRWLCHQSEHLGQDWVDKSQKIDEILVEEGMDLAEETVFLLYSEEPVSIISGSGNCLIARAVIGPKKLIAKPFLLTDWMAAPVWQKNLSGKKLKDLLEESLRFRQTLTEEGEEVASSFILSVKRRHIGDFKISIEVMFYR